MKKQIFKKSKEFPNKFPSISRKITEQFEFVLNYSPKLIIPAEKETKRLLKILGIFFLLCILIVITVNFYLSYQKQQQLILEKEVIKKQIIQFKKINQEFPGHKDALFRLAILKYRIGLFDSAKEDIKDALLLDPNFENAKKLLQMISQAVY